MNPADILIVVAAVAALAGLGWYFFGPRKATAAVLAGGVQRLEVTVRGGYRPEVIRVRQGVPVELTFDRQEAGDCTSRVVFPDFRASAALPAGQRTTVRLDPGEAGEFGFACGMNMIHGTLIVDPAGGTAADGAVNGRQEQAAAVTDAAPPETDGVGAGAPARDGQWLVTTTYSLMHAAAEDAAAGRLDPEDAARLITATLLAAFTPQAGE